MNNKIIICIAFQFFVGMQLLASGIFPNSLLADKPIVDVNNKNANDSTKLLFSFKNEQATTACLNWGFGQVESKASTMSISQISENIIKTNSVTSVEQALNGTLSGLYSIKNGGERFGLNNYNFFIRGLATTANAKPLVIIDNMEGALDFLDFNEVETISILKDATALAIYGMRGANGAIVIKTKRGRSETSSFEVSMSSGIQMPVKISDRLNSYEYTTLYNDALKNDGSQIIYTPEMYDGSQDAYLYPDNDLKKKFIASATPYQYYNFKAYGGNDVTKYFVAASYLNQKGLFSRTLFSFHKAFAREQCWNGAPLLI